MDHDAKRMKKGRGWIIVVCVRLVFFGIGLSSGEREGGFF
jgi:hypothetical protein